MNQIIECVTNVSEGRDTRIIEALITAIQSVPGVAMLDRHVDPDHHRSVLTFAGTPEAVTQAACNMTREAIPLIDLNMHHGEHPRVGAIDVVPLIPLQETTMAECVECARLFARHIGLDFQIPVFLYEEACVVSKRRQLEVIRRGGLKDLASRMAHDPSWAPDFGPPDPHPTAGVMVVGARQLLIAYNVILESDDVVIAQSIARTIRTSGGGLPALKAIGVNLESRGLVQVSMNLTNYHTTSIQDAFFAVQRRAEEFGIGIDESEVVGLVPQDALSPALVPALKIRSWNLDQVLETRLTQVGLK